MPVIKGELKKPDQQSLVPKGKPRLVLPIAPDGKTLPVPENIHKLIHQEQSDVNP